MSDYSPRESLEHEDRVRELVENVERRGMRFVPLAAAVLAVLAGLSSLYSGRLSERMLRLKNEAVLHEVTASDTWAEYQAESIKAHLYGLSAADHTGPQASSLRAKAARFRSEQQPLRRDARAQEAARDRDLQDSDATEQRKARFDVAVALFEISIVLTSIAALARRPWLLIFAAIGGAVGLIYVILGLAR